MIWKMRRRNLYGKSKYEVFTQVLEESGRREPIIFGGLNTTVNYKRWRLNAAFSYSLGRRRAFVCCMRIMELGCVRRVI